MRKVIMVVAVMSLAILWPHAASSEEPTANLRVFAPSSDPYGRTYERWFSRYMVWLQEIPVSSNPLVDPNSPRNCESRGRLVFISPTGSGDGCSIPEGKAIAFTPVGHECSTAEGNGETFRELRRCAIEGFAGFAGPDVLSLTLRIDGRKVAHPRRWVFLTPGEVVDFPDDNIWGAPGGPSRSLTKGFFFIIKPLDEGRHQIRVHVNDAALGEFDILYPVRVD